MLRTHWKAFVALILAALAPMLMAPTSGYIPQNLPQVFTAQVSASNIGIGQVWCIQPTSTQTVTSSITVASDATMQFQSVPAGEYAVDVELSYTYTTSTGGVQWYISGTGISSTPVLGVNYCNNTMSSYTLTTGTALCAGTTGTAYYAAAFGHVTTSSSGNLYVGWAQDVSSATGTVRGTGSHFCIRRLK